MLLEGERLRAERSVELAEIDSELDETNLEIAELESKTPSESAPPSPDGEVRTPPPVDPKLEQLRARRAKLDKDLDERRKRVKLAYGPKILEADRATVRAKADGFGYVQLTLWVKLALDLIKLVGCSLVVLTALRISFDAEQPNGAKAYAAVLGGIAFLSVVVGGLYTMIG